MAADRTCDCGKRPGGVPRASSSARNRPRRGLARASSGRARLRGHRPEREQHPAQGLAQRQAGAAPLPRARPPAARARLGAKNAIAPTRARKQVKFKLDYSGGWGTYRKNVWKTFKDHCQAYDGPSIQWLTFACKAPDGSYWARAEVAAPAAELRAQRQAHAPGLGAPPLALVAASCPSSSSSSTGRAGACTGSTTTSSATCATGASPCTASARRRPAFRWTRSAGTSTSTRSTRKYGTGWKRENSFLTHRGSGVFCYGFYPHGKSPVGKGEKYRATVIGPGVTPDMFWQSEAPGPVRRGARPGRKRRASNALSKRSALQGAG